MERKLTSDVTKVLTSMVKTIFSLSATNNPESQNPNQGASKLIQVPYMVEGGGFEPPKASPTDLQSVPFDHSGTPPHKTEVRRQKTEDRINSASWLLVSGF